MIKISGTAMHLLIYSPITINPVHCGISIIWEITFTFYTVKQIIDQRFLFS